MKRVDPLVLWGPGILSAEERRDALATVSAPERLKHDGLPLARRDGFLRSRMLLRDAARMLGEARPALTISAVCLDCGGDHGPPRLQGSPLQLSASYGGGAVVVAAATTAVGVDVEAIDTARERIAAVGALTGVASLEHWTRVEAILKADGRGLRVDPRDVLIEGDRGQVIGSEARYRLLEPALDASLRVSVAVTL